MPLISLCVALPCLALLWFLGDALGSLRMPFSIAQHSIALHFGRRSKTETSKCKTWVEFGRTEVSVYRSKALREIFRMGMVSGVLVFEGSQIWAAQSIRFQQFGYFVIFGPFFDGFHETV